MHEAIARILVTPKQVVISCDFCSVFYYQKGRPNHYPEDTTNSQYQTLLTPKYTRLSSFIYS